jgi:hypothetical protein
MTEPNRPWIIGDPNAPQVVVEEGPSLGDIPKAPETARYYLLIARGGCEPEQYGPYVSEEDRDAEAREAWAEANQDYDGFFKLQVDGDVDLSFSSYMESELDPNDDNDNDNEDNDEPATTASE